MKAGAAAGQAASPPPARPGMIFSVLCRRRRPGTRSPGRRSGACQKGRPSWPRSTGPASSSTPCPEAVTALRTASALTKRTPGAVRSVTKSKTWWGRYTDGAEQRWQVPAVAEQGDRPADAGQAGGGLPARRRRHRRPLRRAPCPPPVGPRPGLRPLPRRQGRRREARPGRPRPRPGRAGRDRRRGLRGSAAVRRRRVPGVAARPARRPAAPRNRPGVVHQEGAGSRRRRPPRQRRPAAAARRPGRPREREGPPLPPGRRRGPASGWPPASAWRRRTTT